MILSLYLRHSFVQLVRERQNKRLGVDFEQLVASCRTPEEITYMKERYDPSQYDIENEANAIAECFSADYIVTELDKHCSSYYFGYEGSP